MPDFTPNLQLYKWDKTDSKVDTITEMSKNVDKIETKFQSIDQTITETQTNVTTATATAENALTTATQAETTATEANNAAQAAEGKANVATTTANEAHILASEANDTANTVKTQFDEVTKASTIDPQVTQALIGADGKTYANIGNRFDTVDSLLAQKATKGELAEDRRYRPTNMGNRRQIIADGGYTAWPYGCLFVDDYFLVQVYTTGSSHVSNDKKVYCRRVRPNDSDAFGNRILIADKTAEGLGATCHAAGMLANREYIAIVRFTDASDKVISTIIYKSTDQGLTWQEKGQMMINGNPYNPGENGDIFVTSKGTVLTCGTGFKINRSNDNGATWTQYVATNNLTSVYALEASFVEFPTGEILAVARSNINANFTTKMKAVMSISTNDGQTWSPLQFTDITDMTNNNCKLLYHEKENILEIFYGSRFGRGDGFGSLYQSVTTPELALQGKFGTPKRIAVGASTRDFGYPGAAKMDDKVFLTYYNGNPTETSIQMMEGVRGYTNVSAPPLHELVNPISGINHALYNVGDQSLDFVRVRKIHRNNVPIGLMRYGSSFYTGDGGGTLAVNTVPTDNGWQLIDAASLMGENYGEGVGGYIIEVTFELASTIEQQIQFSHYTIQNRSCRIVRKNPTADARKENVTLLVPCVTKGMGMDTATHPLGSFRFKVSDYTAFTSLLIYVIGWTPSN